MDDRQGIPVDRVVAVVLDLGSEGNQVGTGYLVAERMVLTAEHCTRDKKTGGPPRGLRVVRASDGREAGAKVKAASATLDVAVLELDESPWLTKVPATRFGRVDRTRSGELEGCEAIGYPWWQYDPANGWRNTAALRGMIRPTDDAGSGFLVLRDPLLDTVTAPPDPAADDDAKSPWGGLSGALVFCAGLAVGVVVEHRSRQGAASVRLVPFDRIASAVDAETRAVAAAVGLSSSTLLLVDTTKGAADELDELAKWVDGDEFPAVKDLNPYQLGSTSSDYGNRSNYGQHDPYVPRRVDLALRDALQPGQLVLVVGPSKAGKSRTAFEVLLSRWPQAWLVVPKPEGLEQLIEHPRLRDTGEPVAVWLDDLQDYLGGTHPLTPWLLAQLIDRPGPTVVLGTLRLEARNRLRDSTGELSRDTRALLDPPTVTVELASTTDNPDEQAVARAAYPGEDLATVGLAERLANAPDLLDKYYEAKADNPLHYVLVRTAVDWVRVGVQGPIPEPDLLALARDALWAEWTALDPDDRQTSEALNWTRTSLPGSGQIALLSTHPLPGHIRGYWPFDYLVAADDGQAGQPRPIPDPFWGQVVDRVTPDDAFSVGVSAILRSTWSAATIANRKAAEGGIPGGMFFLGVILNDQDPPDVEGARHWWQQAAEAGHTAAMTQLGILLENQEPPDLDGARHWWQQAAETGRTDAMYNLGILQKNQQPPDLDGARRWLQQAADGGNTDAMFSLGEMSYTQDPPDLDGARRWWQQAADAGDTNAMTSLGFLLNTQDAPDSDGARRWLQQAADAGNIHAMLFLAELLNTLDPPDLDGARHWWQQAASRGNPDAMNNLGSLLAGQDPPDLDGARHWWQQAADRGNADAMASLGLLLAKLNPPDSAGARNWLTRASEAGVPTAMTNLGILLQSQDPPDLDGARRWWQQAADLGNTRAMVGLGLLFAGQDPPDLDNARRSYQQAAERGNTNAMKKLARLLKTQDPPHPDDALAWDQRAADAGDTEAMVYIGAVHARQDPPDLDGARDWWRRAADVGSADGMAALGTLAANQDPPDLDGARNWWQQAAQAGSADGMAALGFLAANQDPPDLDGAHNWWQQAAQAGDASAMIASGALLAVEGDIEKARALLLKAVDAWGPAAQEYAAALSDDAAEREAACASLKKLEGDTDALNFLGTAALRAGTLDQARALWTSSANAGDTVAPLLLMISGNP